MNTQKLACVAGVLASVFCLIAGLWILKSVDFFKKDDAIWVGMGLYFIGKAFFVGPMLWISAKK
jgi:hypothetical protein